MTIWIVSASLSSTFKQMDFKQMDGFEHFSKSQRFLEFSHLIKNLISKRLLKLLSKNFRKHKPRLKKKSLKSILNSTLNKNLWEVRNHSYCDVVTDSKKCVWIINDLNFISGPKKGPKVFHKGPNKVLLHTKRNLIFSKNTAAGKKTQSGNFITICTDSNGRGTNKIEYFRGRLIQFF
jgi:hypothetical protein